jgi:hypothetical protein
MNDEPEMPQMPERPTPPPARESSPFTVVLALFITAVFVCGLSIVFAAIFPDFQIIAVGFILVSLFAIVASLHYLIWGRIVGKMIREEEAERGAEDEIDDFERDPPWLRKND